MQLYSYITIKQEPFKISPILLKKWKKKREDHGMESPLFLDIATIIITSVKVH